MNVLVFGAQGSGKSTHAKYVAEKLKVPYIYTGDLFRELGKEDSQRGGQIKEWHDKGILTPNEVSIPSFNEYLTKFDVSKGVVLDGYPRNIGQAQSLPFKINLIVHVTLPEDVAIQRLIVRGRYDDTPETIKKRIELFRKETAPLYDYFKSKGVEVVEVDNSPPIEIVRKKIDDLLEKQRGNKNNA
jgi:adenylate kinase